jgi:hypothetical protein
MLRCCLRPACDQIAFRRGARRSPSQDCRALRKPAFALSSLTADLEKLGMIPRR